MSYRVEINPLMALPAMAALAGVAYMAQPAEFRRSPLLEAKAAVRIVHKYEAYYTDCPDPTMNDDPASLKGFAKGFAGAGGHAFPAASDADAKSFALSARSQCRLYSLSRVDYERRLTGKRYKKRVSIPL